MLSIQERKELIQAKRDRVEAEIKRMTEWWVQVRRLELVVGRSLLTKFDLRYPTCSPINVIDIDGLREMRKIVGPIRRDSIRKELTYDKKRIRVTCSPRSDDYDLIEFKYERQLPHSQEKCNVVKEWVEPQAGYYRETLVCKAN